MMHPSNRCSATLSLFRSHMLSQSCQKISTAEAASAQKVGLHDSQDYDVLMCLLQAEEEM